MSRAKVLHVINQLSQGGGSRAALIAAKYSARQGPFDHALLSLRPASEPGAALAHEAGVQLLSAPAPSGVSAALAEADIVLVHFWNSPELYALLRSDWPPARLLLWLHVAGDSTPQVVTSQVAAFGDRVVAAGAHTADLPVLRRPSAAPSALITAAPDYEKLAGLQAQPHDEFNVGYIGTVDFEKMHPDFVALHAAIDVPNARFIVCGAGGAYPRLRQQAAELCAGERFDFRGYVHDVRPTLSALDVFGYPLRPDNYSSAELALREAMYAGVPPVVFPYAGAGRMVTHNVTGLVVPDADAYRAAVEWLYRQPAERARLGRNARDEAQRHFGPQATAERFNTLFDEMLPAGKHKPVWTGSARGGAQYFVESLGDLGADFAASLACDDLDACLAAEARISAASPLLASAAAGGVLHYRNYYQNDAYLRLWAGLVLLGGGQARPALATAEFTQAARLGLSHWRVAWYQARSAEACGAWELAASGVATALAAAPDFKPARDLAQRLAGRQAARPEPGPA